MGLRLEYGYLHQGSVVLARMHNGSHIASDAPTYRDSLPDEATIRSAKTLAALNDLLGQSRAPSTAWGTLGKWNWTTGWTFVTRETNHRLRYVSVFASVTGAKGAAPSEVFVKKVSISAGSLRPADPESLSELRRFPTGAELFRRERLATREQLEKYPLPLRDLIASRKLHTDARLRRYAMQINTIRSQPQPELFRQIASLLHESDMSIESCLRDIMVGEGYLDLDPWERVQKNTAIQACIDVLPDAKDDRARRTVVQILLEMRGTGFIVIGDREIAVTDDGYRVTDAENRCTLAETQAALKKMMLGGEVAR